MAFIAEFLLKSINYANKCAQAVVQKQQLAISQLNQTQRQLERVQQQLLTAKDEYRVLFVESQLAGATNPSENRILDELEKAVDSGDQDKIRKLLIKAVPGFKPQSEITDILYGT